MTHHSDRESTPLAPEGPAKESLNRTAVAATLHCLFGCAIGEISGLVLGSMLGLGNAATVALAVVLAFISGFALTMLPLLRRSFSFAQAFRVALATDAASITMMEIVDNGLMLVIPGAMHAPIDSLYYWASMLFSLAVGGLAAFPINRWLISRGRGHVHSHHGSPG